MHGIKSLFLLAAAVLMTGLEAADWALKDGTGSALARDAEGKSHLALKGKVSWAREDDRSFFLNFSGGTAECKADGLYFPDGMVLEVFFAPDLARGREWLPVVTCGDTFNSSYSVWVRKNGQLLVCFPGTKNFYNLIDAKLQNLRDYELRVVRGENRAQVTLNGKVVADFPSAGKLTHKPGELFRLGSTPKWKYYGNIYSAKIGNYRKGAFLARKKAEKTFPASEIRPVPGVTDPEGTVVFCEFEKFSPKPLVTLIPHRWRWVYRKLNFFPGYPGVLMSANNAEEFPLTYAPGLTGKYDVYLGLRANTIPIDFMISVPDREHLYRVQIGAASKTYHPNTEVRIAKDVRMDGGKITLYPGGWMFLGYIKFIPSANRRKIDYPQWKCVSVTRSDRTFSELLPEFIQKRIASGYLRERKFVDDRPVPEPGPLSRKLGYIIDRQDWMDLCFENSKPAAAPETITLDVKAAQGEFEPVSFSVHGLEDCGELTLTGADGLEKKGIRGDVAVVLEIPKRTTNIYGPSEFIRGPQCLERTNVCRLEKGKTKQFWLTFAVGENVKPGSYKCELALTSARGKRVIPVTVTVRPFKLDPVVRERTGFFSFPGSCQLYPGLVREMAEHGYNTMHLTMGTDVIFLSNGAVDWKRSPLPGIARDMKKYGMKAMVIQTEPLANTFCKDPDGAARYMRTIREITARAKKENWPDVYFYTFDELLSNLHNKQKALWEVPLIKKCGARLWNSHLWYKTTRPCQDVVDKIAPAVDAYGLRYSTRKLWYVDTWPEIAARCAREGKELWSYNIDNAIVFSKPAAKRFAMGWFFRTIGRGAIGQMVHCYFFIDGSPYTELDGGTGESVDWCYNLPPDPRHKGGFIINYEAMREGVDDLRYITTLENRIASAGKKGLVKEAAAAEKVLKDLKSSFDFDENFTKNSVFLDSHFERSWMKDGKRFCSGRFNLPGGWKFEDYHAAREKIAAEIARLDALLQ
ncbi:MAG: hypothetical protein IJU70_03225 [Lentisphaeria bacterium]|nr:hypothetical protein [Lentisphaeria bacterium]